MKQKGIIKIDSNKCLNGYKNAEDFLFSTNGFNIAIDKNNTIIKNIAEDILFGNIDFELEIVENEIKDDNILTTKDKDVLENDNTYDDTQERDYQLEDEIDSESDSQKINQAITDFKLGNEEAYEYIYKIYQPIMDRWSRRYNNEDLGMEILDIVLYSAVTTFNPSNGAKFNTYFWKCAQNHINCYKTKVDAQKRGHYKNMQSLNQTRQYKNDSSDVELEQTIPDLNANMNPSNNELKISILSMKDCLKQNEIDIILKIIDGYTLQEIGDHIGVTPSAVCMSLKRLASKAGIAKKLKDIICN